MLTNVILTCWHICMLICGYMYKCANVFVCFKICFIISEIRQCQQIRWPTLKRPFVIFTYSKRRGTPNPGGANWGITMNNQEAEGAMGKHSLCFQCLCSNVSQWDMTLIKMAKIKRVTIPNIIKYMEHLELLDFVESTKCCNIFERCLAIFSYKVKHTCTLWLTNSTFRYLGVIEMYFHPKTCKRIFVRALVIII